MRLHELTSVRKYRDKPIHDVLRDFQIAGGKIMGNGKYGTVIWHPQWNYVFKFFEKDDHYVRFIRWAKRHQSLNALPRIYGGPWRIVPFYRRAVTEPYVYVVKMERLEPIADAELREKLLGWLDRFRILEIDQLPGADAGVAAYVEAEKHIASLELSPRHSRRARAEYDQSLDSSIELRSQWRELHEMREVWARYPSVKALMQAYGELCTHGPQSEHDMHIGNFMQRPDGTLVMTDPLWRGISFAEMQRAALDAETDYDPGEPEPMNDYNSLPGGKIRPKKRPKPPKSATPDIGADDMPF